MGETGCGKTFSIGYLAAFLGVRSLQRNLKKSALCLRGHSNRSWLTAKAGFMLAFAGSILQT